MSRLFPCLFLFLATALLAQGEAELAYREARAAYAAQDYATAIQRLREAHALAPERADILTLLGDAHFARVELDEARAAWSRSLALAPEQTRVAERLAALEGRAAVAETELALAEALLADGLYLAAEQVLAGLVPDSDASAARRLALRADLALRRGQVEPALVLLAELAERFPEAADAPDVRLLVGTAGLRAGGSRAVAGRARLELLAAELPATVEGGAAALELVLAALEARPEAVEELAGWIGAHPEHPRALAAQQRLLAVRLEAARAAPLPAAGLGEADRQALEQAVALFARLPDADAQTALVRELIEHLHGRYGKAQAFAAEREGLAALAGLALPRAASRHWLRARGRSAVAGALQAWGRALQEGRAPDEAALEAAVAALGAERAAFPGSGFARQAALAVELAALDPAYGLAALDVAEPCLADPAVRETAARIFRATAEQADDPQESAALLGRLLAALPEDAPDWPAHAYRALDAHAAADDDAALVDLAARLVAGRPALSGEVAARLTAAFAPRVAEGRFAGVLEVWEGLLAALPEAAQAPVRLARIRTWSQQVAAAHARRAAAGLALPAALDPASRAALEECYRLEGRLAPDDALHAALLAEREVLIARFTAAGAVALAEEAWGIKAGPAVPAADARAALALAGLYAAEARAELGRRAREFAGRERLERTPAVARAVEAFQKFLTGHPEHPRADEAEAGLLGLAEACARLGAPRLAAELYAELEVFAAAVPGLEPRQPGAAGFRDRAALARAAVLASAASAGLAEQAEPVLDERFRAALDAYRHIFATYPERPALVEARAGFRGLALELARAGGWDAAAAVFAELREALPELEAPAAVALARARCLLGKLRPVHALTALGASVPQQLAVDLQPANNYYTVEPAPVLAPAERERLRAAEDAAYAALVAVRSAWPESVEAEEARLEIFGLVELWRQQSRHLPAAALLGRFLADFPRDPERPALRLSRGRALLVAAGQPSGDTPEDRLAALRERYATAREELAAIAAELPGAVADEALWLRAHSHIDQARAVGAIDPARAPALFVRAARELEAVAANPFGADLPALLFNLGQELQSRAALDEAIEVWTRLRVRYPTAPVADQAAAWVAAAEQQRGRPLRATETWLELNFTRGGADAASQNAILAIALQLEGENRWVEALRVLETFVDSFPRHPELGQALTRIGRVHEVNGAWEDAIAAYERVRREVAGGTWPAEAQWAIAQCTINLSRWRDAVADYRAFVASYPNDGRIAEAARRIVVLARLARFQDLIDEEGQRRAFDAQFQIGAIAASELANPVKAVEEFRKVTAGWPDSHLADDALFEAGELLLGLGDAGAARALFEQLAERYPSSPLADDALFLVGQSYVQEADRLASVTRDASNAYGNELAQRQAYQLAQGNRREQRARNEEVLEDLEKRGDFDALARTRASQAAQNFAFDNANAMSAACWAEQQAEVLSAEQLADRQDRINAALRRAVEAFGAAAAVAAGDKADVALLEIAAIQDERLEDRQAAMATWLEITRQYSGTAVAENASWKIALYYEREGSHELAIEAYTNFLRNYRRSPHAGQAQFAIGESLERLGRWVEAMDAYTKYLTNFPDGPLGARAQEQIDWIKTYRL